MIPADHVLRGKKLVGVRMGDIDPPTDIPALAKRYLSGDLPLDHLITGHLSLEETNAGFDQMRSVDGTRTVVVFPE